MLRTLHGYLIRDLLRVTIMALAAFTLVLTVIAIIEPLRKQGLEPNQMIHLFLLLVPIMLALTFPFSALFATSIVYGRFSQDREMLACRASGISHLTILQPALMLAIVVSVLTLVLTNFVVPKMLQMSARIGLENIQKIAYHKINKEGHYKYTRETGKRQYFIHASYVDEKNNILYGVVAGQLELKDDPAAKAEGKTPVRQVPVMEVVVAQAAHLDIHHDPATNQYTASIIPQDMVGPITNHPGLTIEGEEVSFRNLPIPNYMEDKPSFYDWDSLVRMYKDPTLHGEIRSKMEVILKLVHRQNVLESMAETIRVGKAYSEFHKGDRQFSLRAMSVSVSGDRAILSSGVDKNGKFVPVTMTVTKGKTSDVLEARTCEVLARPSQITNEPQITIILKGDVRMPVGRSDTPEAPRTPELKIGQIPLPADRTMPRFDDPQRRKELLSALYHRPKDFTKDETILSQIESLRTSRPSKIRGEILAVMNLRLAFGISCVFLVALGAALGVIFRGGQVLAAFVISVAPATVLLVLMYAGYKVISNPRSSNLVGMVIIWGGLAAVLIANIVLYYRLSKQ